MKKRRWTAFLLAGQRPGTDPMAAAFGVHWKALIKVAGRPMLARCLDTLAATEGVSRIVVLAQEPEQLLADPEVDESVTLIAAHAQEAEATVSICGAVTGSGIASSVAALAEREGRWPILLTTADHPLLRPETVTAFLNEAAASGSDIAVAMVERAVVTRAFPHNRRTWLHFKNGSWTGANLFALNSPASLDALRLWADIEQHRKKGWRLIARFGPMLLLRALTRTITLQDALAKAGRRIGVSVRVVPLTDPLAAVDVDKPSDHALAEELLKERS